MAMMTASHLEGEGSGTLEEEVVVGASYRATTVASASRAMTDAYFALRRRAMKQTRVWASVAIFSTAWTVAILLVACCYRAVGIGRVGAMEIGDPEER
jgi:hypothetical protein